MSEVTPAIVRGLWAQLSKELRSTVVNKPSATEMQAIASVLGAMGIVDAYQFLSNYATTLDHRIYVPFTVGEPLRGWTLWAQLTTAVHEHQHVAQVDEYGSFVFALRYLTSKSGRALLEADAFRTELELHFWRFGVLPDLTGFAAARLTGYGLSADEILIAQRMLELSGESIRRGAVLTRAGRIALDWLNANAASLRLSGPSA